MFHCQDPCITFQPANWLVNSHLRDTYSSELASHWVFAFSDPGLEKQDRRGVPTAMTERNTIWLCVNEGQLNLLFYLKPVVSATVVKLTHKIKQSVYMQLQVLQLLFPLSFPRLSSPPSSNTVSLSRDGPTPAVFSFSASNTLNPKNGCYFFLFLFFFRHEQSNTTPKPSLSSIYSYPVVSA